MLAIVHFWNFSMFTVSVGFFVARTITSPCSWFGSSLIL